MHALEHSVNLAAYWFSYFTNCFIFPILPSYWYSDWPQESFQKEYFGIIKLLNFIFDWLAGRLKTFIYGLLRAPSVFTFMLWTRLKCKDWKSIVYCTSHCVYLYPQVEEFFFLLLRAAVFRRAPKQHSIEKVVAAKLHFTDNNLAASIYLDARTNTHTKKVPTWETTNRKPRIGLLFTLYACRKKNPQCKIHFVRYPA